MKKILAAIFGVSYRDDALTRRDPHMKKILATIFAVSSLALAGCDIDFRATASAESTADTKLPVVMRDNDNVLLLVGVYDDVAHTIRVSSEFMRHVQSKSTGTPAIVVSNASYPFDKTNQSVVNEEVGVGDTADLIAADDQGNLLHWKLEIATPGTEAETATQTQFEARCVFE